MQATALNSAIVRSWSWWASQRRWCVTSRKLRRNLTQKDNDVHRDGRRATWMGRAEWFRMADSSATKKWVVSDSWKKCALRSFQVGECVVARKMACLEGTGSSMPPAHTPPYTSLPSGCSRGVPFKINQSVQEEGGGGKRKKNVHLINE